jgi:ribonuclease HI
MLEMLPEYVLTSAANTEGAGGVWSFRLEGADGGDSIEAADREPGVHRERLELLAIVRGLEALDQPSRVTIRTASQYVRRGIAYGLEEWRTNGWTWEHYGQMVKVKNHDLWQRLDRALRIHDVSCRQWRIDPPAAAEPIATAIPPRTDKVTPARVRRPHFLSDRVKQACRSLIQHGGSVEVMVGATPA